MERLVQILENDWVQALILLILFTLMLAGIR